MSQIIIIAGPQAAGKSTIVERVSAQMASVSPLFSGGAPLFFPMQESRQIVVHKYMLLGAIFMNSEHEEEVVRCDFDRMRHILRRNHKHLVYLDECNVFTLAHAAAHNVSDVWKFWDSYEKYLESLNAAVIFLDVSPDISWDRRQHQYEKRLVYFPAVEHKQIMHRYREYLHALYPRLCEVYDRLPFPKVKIDAHSTEDNVLKDVYAALSGFINLA